MIFLQEDAGLTGILAAPCPADDAAGVFRAGLAGCSLLPACRGGTSRRLHGHSYRAEVAIRGRADAASGMVARTAHLRNRLLALSSATALRMRFVPHPIGHNGGPPLDEDRDPGDASWKSWIWRRAHKKAWKAPGREIALRRLARAEELGVSYRDYTLEILERGRHL